jgi:DNA (cytosine-5)-methyltransferase 1
MKPEPLNELALFAGAGGGILGSRLLAWRTICAVERDAYARDVLVARQNDGSLEPFPIWDDIQTFDGGLWRGRVDVVSGGFPCQDISVAGSGEGIDGGKSGLWGEMARVICEVEPQHVFVENSPALTVRGLGRVLGDLAEMGYDARWGVLGAVHAGAPHKRDRIWIVANANRAGLQDGWAESDRSMARSDEGGQASSNNLSAFEEPSCGSLLADTDLPRCEEQRSAITDGEEYETAKRGGWWAAEPDVGRMAHGVAARVDRLRCLGNGQVPRVAALAWNLLR